MAVIPNPYPPVQDPSASDITFTTGEAAYGRLLAAGQMTLTSQAIALTYFTVQRSETVGYVTTMTTATAATGLTYAAVGVYEVTDTAGDLILAGQSANLAASLWASEFTMYATQLAAPFAKQAGQVYAVALLAVGSGMPQIACAAPAGALVTGTFTPNIVQSLTGQTTLPATIAAISLTPFTYFTPPQAILSPTAAP